MGNPLDLTRLEDANSVMQERLGHVGVGKSEVRAVPKSKMGNLKSFVHIVLKSTRASSLEYSL